MSECLCSQVDKDLVSGARRTFAWSWGPDGWKERRQSWLVRLWLRPDEEEEEKREQGSKRHEKNHRKGRGIGGSEEWWKRGGESGRKREEGASVSIFRHRKSVCGLKANSLLAGCLCEETDSSMVSRWVKLSLSFLKRFSMFEGRNLKTKNFIFFIF